jgi:hypothetical protein
MDTWDTAIEYQLCLATPVNTSRSGTSFVAPSTSAQENDHNIESNPTLRVFTTAQFIELLDAVGVLFLTRQSDINKVMALGEGTFAEVMYGKMSISEHSDATAVAVKVFRERQSISDKLENVQQIEALPTEAITQAYIEVCIMKHHLLSKHPNIFCSYLELRRVQI